MPAGQREIYKEYLSDWVTLRRSFRLETEINPDALARQLARMSTPPPMDRNPLSVATPVAITQTATEAIVFEINVARGLPVAEGYYVPFKAVGRVSEKDGKTRLAGEIRPLSQGVVVYVIVLAALLLWVAASVTSAALSPYGSYVAVAASLVSTALLGLYMLLLQWQDMRRIVRLLRAATDAD